MPVGCPRVSVVLTSYNHAPYLRQAIDSVIDQTFSDWELLIWDDCSSDESRDIIRSYEDPRIRPILNERTRRYIYAINQSINSVAKGDYVAVHHSDDAWAPAKLERQVACLDERPDVSAVFSHVQLIDEENNAIENDWFNVDNMSRAGWLRSLFFNQNHLCHPSVLLRRRIFEKTGPYKLALGQTDDAEMWTRLLLSSDIHVIPEKLTLHRVSRRGLNVSSDTPQSRARLNFEWFEHKKHYAGLSVEGLLEIFPEAEKWCSRSGKSDAGFILAMVAINLGDASSTHLFGFDLLYGLLSDPVRAKTIEDAHNFTYLDFIAISGRGPLFHQAAPVTAGRSMGITRHIPERVRRPIRRLLNKLPG